VAAVIGTVSIEPDLEILPAIVARRFHRIHIESPHRSHDFSGKAV
jgi:hypothetical protein